MSKNTFIINNIIKAIGLNEKSSITFGLCLHCNCIRLVHTIWIEEYSVFRYLSYKCTCCNIQDSEKIITLKEMSEVGNSSIRYLFLTNTISKKKLKAFRKDLEDIEDYLKMSNPTRYKKCNGCGKEYPKCGCLGGGPDRYYTWVTKDSKNG